MQENLVQQLGEEDAPDAED